MLCDNSLNFQKTPVNSGMDSILKPLFYIYIHNRLTLIAKSLSCHLQRQTLLVGCINKVSDFKLQSQEVCYLCYESVHEIFDLLDLTWSNVSPNIVKQKQVESTAQLLSGRPCKLIMCCQVLKCVKIAYPLLQHSI